MRKYGRKCNEVEKQIVVKFLINMMDMKIIGLTTSMSCTDPLDGFVGFLNTWNWFCSGL